MQIYRHRENKKHAKGVLFLPTIKLECDFKSTQKHLVNMSGFALTHAYYLTATASQGQALLQESQ